MILEEWRMKKNRKAAESVLWPFFKRKKVSKYIN